MTKQFFYSSIMHHYSRCICWFTALISSSLLTVKYDFSKPVTGRPPLVEKEDLEAPKEL